MTFVRDPEDSSGSGGAGQPRRAGEDGHDEGATTGAIGGSSQRAVSARRPYKKPELRLLGSVRDLTFGSPVATLPLDGMGGRTRIM